MVASGALLTRRSSAMEGYLSGSIAEIAGAFLCASLGFAPTVRHADCVGSWHKELRDDNCTIARAASAASRAADCFLAFRADAVAPAVGFAEPETV